MMNKEQKHSKDQRLNFRVNLWADLAIAYTSASNSTDAKKVSEWCDTVLADFDERFGHHLIEDGN